MFSDWLTIANPVRKFHKTDGSYFLYSLICYTRLRSQKKLSKMKGKKY
jgi:hypothetical protein